MTLAEFKELPQEERFKMITITKIVERADNLNLLYDDWKSLIMDLDVANKKFDLRLNELLLKLMILIFLTIFVEYKTILIEQQKHL